MFLIRTYTINILSRYLIQTTKTRLVLLITEMDFNPLDDVNTNMGKLFTLLNSMDTRAEDRHKFIKSELSVIKSEQVALKSSHLKLKEKCQVLANEVVQMKCTLNRFEQQEIINNVVIRGVPEISNEQQSDTKNIVYEIFKLMNIVADVDDVLDIFRFGMNKNSPRPIMLKLRNNVYKNLLISSKRKIRLSAASIIYNGTPIGSMNNLIFMDEQLTPFSASIYYGARNMKKEKIVAYAWTRNGTVFVKKDDKSKTINLRSPREVADLYKRLTGRTMVNDDLSSSFFDYEDELEVNSHDKSTESPNNQGKRRKK